MSVKIPKAKHLRHMARAVESVVASSERPIERIVALLVHKAGQGYTTVSFAMSTGEAKEVREMLTEQGFDFAHDERTGSATVSWG